MPNNRFIHVSVLTYKDRTCLCSVVFIYKRTEDNSLLRKSVGLSAPLQKKKKPARCSWLTTLEKILKPTERARCFGSSAAIMILSNMLQKAIAVKCCKTTSLLNEGHARTLLNTRSWMANSASSQIVFYTSFQHELWVCYILTEMPWWWISSSNHHQESQGFVCLIFSIKTMLTTLPKIDRRVPPRSSPQKAEAERFLPWQERRCCRELFLRTTVATRGVPTTVSGNGQPDRKQHTVPPPGHPHSPSHVQPHMRTQCTQ